MFEEFNGKVALVTGGATGMGRATALKFASLGCRVAVATARNLDGAQAVVDEIKAAGGEAFAIRCDVSDSEQVQAMISAVAATYGRIDYAFNNAGIGPDGVRIPYGPLHEVTETDWDNTLATNLKGVFLCLKYELQQMHRQGGKACIVNTSSVGGIRMAPGFGAYGPSKAGVLALTQLAARENAGAGIRVNAVAPGPTDGTTLMDNTRASSGGHTPEGIIPLKKLGQPEDVANAVIWLCSDAAGHTTGQTLSVDGGLHVC